MAGKNKKDQKEIGVTQLISLYMEAVMERNEKPASVFMFCKEHGLTEEEFYQHFGSLRALEKGVWAGFYDHVLELLHKDNNFASYGEKEKLLSFYFTFIEVLRVNRSYVLLVTEEGMAGIQKLEQLSVLRRRVKQFASQLIEGANERKQLKIFKRSPEIFSEGAWLQLLVIVKFWINDDSPGFEKTDAFIEKSVQVVFDLLESTPLENIFDLGKFLWKEKVSV